MSNANKGKLQLNRSVIFIELLLPILPATYKLQLQICKRVAKSKLLAYHVTLMMYAVVCNTGQSKVTVVFHAAGANLGARYKALVGEVPINSDKIRGLALYAERHR